MTNFSILIKGLLLTQMVKDYVSLKTLFPKLPSSYMCFSKPVIPRQVSCVPEILLCTSFYYVQPKKERKKKA